MRHGDGVKVLPSNCKAKIRNRAKWIIEGVIFGDNLKLKLLLEKEHVNPFFLKIAKGTIEPGFCHPSYLEKSKSEDKEGKQ
jgi:hypothetical protein